MFNLDKTPRFIQAASENAQGMRIFAKEGDFPTLHIMDDIGEGFDGSGISAREIGTFLSDNKGRQVKALFNSYGGDAFEGLVIHNAFQEHGNVEAVVEGIAFSAASIAAMGASRLVMKEASSFGIHRSWTVAAGNSKGLQGAIEWLNSVDDHQAAIFEAKTGKPRAEIEAWLDGVDDGTIFSATAALEAGFADEVIPIKTSQKPKQEAHAAYAYDRMMAQLKHRMLVGKR